MSCLESKKTVVCVLHNLTRRKLSLLDRVNNAWKEMVIAKTTTQAYKNKTLKEIRAENRRLHPDIYSKYVSQANRQNTPRAPIHLDTQDMFKVIKTDNKIKWFAKIAIASGLHIFCPLKTRIGLDGYDIHDSKLLKRDNHYELHLVVSKDVPANANPSSILSVDMGEKVIATAVLLRSSHFDSKQNLRPMFMGRKVRGIRRHCAWLRKRLQERKLYKGRLEHKLKGTEHRKVNAILHKISRELVDTAKENNAVIVIGDLTGIRKSAKGKRMNRILANMPYYILTQFITYKAIEAGVLVAVTREWYTSQVCHYCGSDNTSRPYQGLLICHACNHRWNADYNGAMNIGKRLWNYMFQSGVVGFKPVSEPRPSPFEEESVCKSLLKRRGNRTLP